MTEPQPHEMGEMTTRFARVDPGPSQTFGALSAVITVVGAALLIVSFTVLDWLNGGPKTFAHIHSDAAQFGSAVFSGPARLYFGWLGWVLLVVTVVFALLAAVPTIGGPFRAITPIVVIFALVMTFLSIKLTTVGDSYGKYLSHARLGFYAAIIGFILTGIGALVGPDRRH